MSKEIDSEEVYEDDTPELEQADALEDYDAVEDEKQAAKIQRNLIKIQRMHRMKSPKRKRFVAL